MNVNRTICFNVGLLFLLTACSNVDLKDAKEQALSIQSTIDFCTTDSKSVRSNLKYVFVIDRSTSNKELYIGDDANGNPMYVEGSDPDGKRRFEALLEFVDLAQDDPYIYWSIIQFEQDLLTGSEFQQNFTNDKSQFRDFVEKQYVEYTQNNSIDSGWTNYKEALEQIRTMIQTDISVAEKSDPLVSSNYVVFFISDGVPRVRSGNTSVIQDADSIYNLVESIENLEEGNRLLVEGVQLHTAYYYNDAFFDQNAETLLREMANRGQGVSLSFNSGERIDFGRFAPPVRISRMDLKELWVTNVNTVWHDGELKRDSDSDSLPDDLEIILGSLPEKMDSDENGVSDGVEYRLSGNVSPCRDVKCDPAASHEYLSCGPPESQSPTVFKDSDGDFLNDCEEKLLGSNFQDPDTNLDYIPDYFAFRSGVSVSETSNVGFLDPDSDGLSNYEELRKNTPIRVHNEKVLQVGTLNLIGGRVSTTVERDCYSFGIKELFTLNDNDLIRVYLMENTKTLDEKRIMRVAEKPRNQVGAAFTESDFKTAAQ